MASWPNPAPYSKMWWWLRKEETRSSIQAVRAPLQTFPALRSKDYLLLAEASTILRGSLLSPMAHRWPEEITGKIILPSMALISITVLVLEPTCLLMDHPFH